MAAVAELPCRRCSLSCSPSSAATEHSYSSTTASPSPHRSRAPPRARCRPAPSPLPAVPSWHCSADALLLLAAWPAKARRGHGWPRPSPNASPPCLRRPLPRWPSPPSPRLAAAPFLSDGGRRRTSRDNRGKGRGLSEELVTDVNSTHKDLFADV